MSANTGILTYNAGVQNLRMNYYAPSATIATTGQYVGTFYCFLAKVDPWPLDEVPPTPEQSQSYINNVFKNMFVAKKINTNEISPVVERIDWTNGEVYDYYTDQEDMFAKNEDGTLVKKFYVKNSFDQVFKCLWNNNGAPSTIQPSFQPGTFNANQIFQGADDYKWKYLYTVTSGNKLRFMDENWMPVPVPNTSPNPIYTTQGIGSIDVINVTDGGSGYDTVNAAVTVTITGDGQYASANATVVGGSVTDIVVANTGINYSYANASITSAQGSGATAIAPVSPTGGHGTNPLDELGANRIMLTATFDKNEGGKLPTDIDFRQIGVLVNPYSKYGVSYALANAAIYRTTTDYVVSLGLKNYIQDETVFQSVDGSIENATFTATVLSFDSGSNTVKLINIVGTPLTNAILYGKTSGTTRVILQEQLPDFVKNSGYMIYIENRSPVQRNADGSEQFKLVLGY